MIVPGKDEIMSREGTTQGDNLTMSFYAVGITPLLTMIENQMPRYKTDFFG